MIDLRSDTVTRPGPEMREAMAHAAVGDDVWGDDPTVAELEAFTADLLGKSAGLFVPSGTQSNLCGLLAHCARGDEYIVGDSAHTYRYEAGGAAVLGSIQPQPVRTLASGMVDLEHVRSVVKPDDPHFARSRLLSIENTHDGKVIGLADLAAARAAADEHGLSLHLDGARLWNAAVALDVAPADVAAPFDSVSVCLSKGLGAPVGSVLVGSQELITDARRWRKMLGGAMRQAGIIAAGGLHALTHNIGRLAEDHANAAHLAAGLAGLPNIEVTAQNTNMVFVSLGESSGHNGDEVTKALAAQDILAAFSGGHSRMVLHLDVTREDTDRVIEAMRDATA